LGVDGLTVDWSTAYRIAYGVQKSNDEWAYFGYGGNTAVTLDALLAVSQENSQRYGYLNQGYSASVTWSSIENITVLGGEYDDVFGYQTGALNSVIAGNGGTDTFFADWSSWSEDITWVNDGTAKTFVHAEVSITVSGVESLLLQTGSGNDFIDNTANYTSDEIRTGQVATP
jgi:hypothetical protein